MRNFLDIDLINSSDLNQIIDQAIIRKNKRRGLYNGEVDTDKPLKNLILAMLFEIPSTRTRVSFDVAIRQLGGQSLIMNSDQMQLGRGESIADTSRVLSNYVDLIMLRCLSHESLLDMATFSSVPVINGLTDRSHPCQVLADLMTFIEKKGDLKGKKFVWYGDFNNVTRSWVHASAKFNFNLIISCPKNIDLDKNAIDHSNSSGGNVVLINNPEEAAIKADCIITDVWVSMSDTLNKNKLDYFVPYKVTESLMQRTNDALFMHCLPAYRGKEVDANVIDGKNSVVWQEAENRLHVQKSILLWCNKK
tara:strand:+ start:235 stop:1152 length:918 start_codon:yes stop_codon:yes gene_type:complete